MNNIPLVVIFGRANVGKSTLFNTLTEKKKAITSNIEGTTRDANIGLVFWRGQYFNLVDTGGITDLLYLSQKKIHTNDIEACVQRQVRDYLEKANLILFLIDAKTGIIQQDKEMALFLKKIIQDHSKIILVINKADRPHERKNLGEYYQISLGEPNAISAITGSGTGDLLDKIINYLKNQKIKKSNNNNNLLISKQKNINVCILGRPNAGKSSLLNSLLGKEKVIVSEIPHTTREPHDIIINYQGINIKFIDTAGISKSGQKELNNKNNNIKTEKDLIKSGIAKSLQMLKKSDIALLVLDISEPITHQDQRIMKIISEKKKSVIIVANKWDKIIERNTEKFKNFIHSNFPFARWAEIQFISAKTGEKVKKIFDLVLKISNSRHKKITNSTLNSFMMTLVKKHRPSKGKGTHHPRIRKFEQTGINPPKFVLNIGSQEDLHFSYLKFIENRLREKFELIGTPIIIKVQKNKKIQNH